MTVGEGEGGIVHVFGQPIYEFSRLLPRKEEEKYHKQIYLLRGRSALASVYCTTSTLVAENIRGHICHAETGPWW